jgi:periplasmic protein TonB
MNGISGPNPAWGKKEFTISALIHGCLIALILFASGHHMKKAPELATFFLDNEKVAPQPEKPGGDGRKAGSEGKDKRAAKGTPKTVFRRVATPVTPTAMAAVRPPEPGDTAPVLPPRESPAPTATYEGIKGNGDGEGGGGGRGIGAYGSGSGFGGVGRDGMGGGKGTGSGPSKKADVDRYLKENYQYIRDLILKHLAYPSMAKKMGWEGRVTISFVIMESGRAESLRVARSSGYTILDDNVVETIKEVQPFPKPPAAARISIPIAYSLDKT